MDYLVAGWNKFNFLLSPDELKRIFEKYHMVIFGAHVPMDYIESSLDEYVSAYSRLYNLLLSGEKIVWKRDYNLFLHRGVTSDLSNCIYGHIHMYEGKQYKSANFNEPVVGISPMTLYVHVGEDQKLHCSSAYSYAVYAESYLGIQLQFPKMIQYRFGDGYEALKSTRDLKTYQDFQELRTSIRKISHVLTIKAAGMERRTDLWVSDAAKNMLDGCYSFRQEGVTVK